MPDLRTLLGFGTGQATRWEADWLGPRLAPAWSSTTTVETVTVSLTDLEAAATLVANCRGLGQL